MSNPFRLSDRTVGLVSRPPERDEENIDLVAHHLAVEVKASRKLIADLRALPYDYITVNLLQQMIGKAGL